MDLNSVAPYAALAAALVVEHLQGTERILAGLLPAT